MKKILLILATILIVSSCCKNDDEIDITSELGDQGFINWCIRNIDLNGDGRISDIETKKVENIMVLESYIMRSIHGLYHFTNLRFLSIPEQDITKLDLTHNPKLLGLCIVDGANCTVIIKRFMNLNIFHSGNYYPIYID